MELFVYLGKFSGRNVEATLLCTFWDTRVLTVKPCP